MASFGTGIPCSFPVTRWRTGPKPRPRWQFGLGRLPEVLSRFTRLDWLDSSKREPGTPGLLNQRQQGSVRLKLLPRPKTELLKALQRGDGDLVASSELLQSETAIHVSSS